jgi:hypothetical protein
VQNFKTLAKPLLWEFGWGSSCSSCCYHGKTKSTPRFGLGWEFDNIKEVGGPKILLLKILDFEKIISFVIVMENGFYSYYK